jgi:hypothetical protein
MTVLVEYTNNSPRMKHRIPINGYDIYNHRSWFDNLAGKTGYYARLMINGQQVTNHPYYIAVESSEDPRAFEWKGDTWVVFNALTKPQQMSRRMFLHNCCTGATVELQSNGVEHTQKNWSPLIHNDELYFVYSIQPLAILKMVDENGQCELVYGEMTHQRGSKGVWNGTPYILRAGRYIGFGHTRNPFYATPVEIDFDKRKVVVHEPIVFTKPKEANLDTYRTTIVQYPYHFVLNKGGVDLFVEFQDHCPTRVTIDYSTFEKYWR